MLSRSQRGVLWTHNDSGDAPRLLAVGLDGRLLADVAVTGAEAFDWEDIAAGPGALYVGDIGDNVAAARHDRRLPRAPSRASAGGPSAAPATRLELRYPDGRHDAEALLRDPVSGALVVVDEDARAAGPGSTSRPSPAAGDDDDAAPQRQPRARDAGRSPRATSRRTGARSSCARTTARSSGAGARARASPPRCGAGRAPPARGSSARDRARRSRVAADGRAFYTVPGGPGAADAPLRARLSDIRRV